MPGGNAADTTNRRQQPSCLRGFLQLQFFVEKIPKVNKLMVVICDETNGADLSSEQDDFYFRHSLMSPAGDIADNEFFCNYIVTIYSSFTENIYTHKYKRHMYNSI